MNTHRRCRGWWPDKPVYFFEPEFVCQVAEAPLPMRIVRLLRKAETTAVPQELFKLFWEATGQILRQRSALLAFQTIMRCVVAWYAIPCPWQASRGKYVEQQKRGRFEVVSSRTCYMFAERQKTR